MENKPQIPDSNINLIPQTYLLGTAMLKSGLIVGLIINLVHIALMIGFSGYDWNIYTKNIDSKNSVYFYLFQIFGNFVAGLVIMIVFRGFFNSIKRNFISSGFFSAFLIWLVTRIFNADLVVLDIIPMDIFLRISLWLGITYMLAGFIGSIYFKSQFKIKLLAIEALNKFPIQPDEIKLNP